MACMIFRHKANYQQQKLIRRQRWFAFIFATKASLRTKIMLRGAASRSPIQERLPANSPSRSLWRSF
jgi:hypothetical protein